MTRGLGACKVDAIEVGEIHIIVIGAPTPTMVVKYALANSETETRFGAGNRSSNFSAETDEKLRDLIASIERDIAAEVFVEGVAREDTIGGGEDGFPDTTDGVPSL